MQHVSQIYEYRFPSGADWDVAGLGIPISDLANQLGVTLQDWIEDGLGAARGAFIQLPSGRVVLIREFNHASRNFGWRSTDVVVDAGDLAALGVHKLVNEVVSACGLYKEAIAWIGEDEEQSKAAAVLHAWQARNANGR